MKRIARSAILERSADALYAMIEDIESYPEFLPWCSAAHVRERSAARTVATLDVGAGGVRHSFTTENENTPGRAIVMRLLEGPFRHFAAQWNLTPLGPQATKIEFRLEYEFTNRVVARALEPLFKRIADSTVEAFAHHATGRPDG